MQHKSKSLFIITFLLLSPIAQGQGEYDAHASTGYTQDTAFIERVRGIKELLNDIDTKSLRQTVDDLERTQYPQINLQIKEAVAKTYADLVREYSIEDKNKKEWLYSMVCLNMAYLQFGGGSGSSGGFSSLNRLICQKLKGYLPLDALKEHGMLYTLD